MRLNFTYNREKDVWCLLNYGKSSNNSPLPTKMYQKLVTSFSENPTSENTGTFIDKYISENNIDIQKYIIDYQQNWEKISAEYQEIAEKIFKVTLPKDITAYITINNRCPYNIENNLFFVSLYAGSSNHIAMHELWHFYTWYKFGKEWQEKLGKQKYNDLKESLTALLNLECKNLLGEKTYDAGYPQHKELRESITKFWTKEKDIEKLWSKIVV